MKKILSFVLLLTSLSLTNCSSNEDEIPAQQSILKVDVDGQTKDFANLPNEFPYIEAKLINDKRLVINAIISDNARLTLTIGETFLNNPIVNNSYKIGTMQDNLETNIQFFDVNDTSTGTISPSTEYYTGVYGCDVLSSDQKGEINITQLDTQNKIVSGNFSANGIFSLPYIEETETLNPDRNLVSTIVNNYPFMSDDFGFNSRRSNSSGIDKIKITAQDLNFGRIRISVPTNVVSGNTYLYNPDGSFQSLGVTFENRINIPENLLFNNPNQSNDSYISIISHDPVTNIIEGTFYVENSEIDGRTIIDGYFKSDYIDNID